MKYYLYAKFKGDRTFRAFNLTAGTYAGNLIYCTVIGEAPNNGAKLQRIADRNRDLGLVLQLRDPKTGRVSFQTD